MEERQPMQLRRVGLTQTIEFKANNEADGSMDAHATEF